MTKKKTFMQGAVILAAAGVVIKMMGAVFRIPLANLIGKQGMAYYQAAYPIYVLFQTISTAGIPVAISRMVSERIAVNNHKAAHRVFRVSFALLFGIGAISFLICFFGAEFLLSISSEAMWDAKYAMRAIAPALLFVPIQAAYRGYFQGMQNMKPTATSQIFEQFFRVVTGLCLAYFLLSYSEPFAAAGAAFGATAGAIGGLIVIIIIYYKKRNSIKMEIAAEAESQRLSDDSDNVEAASEILMKIFVIAVPITIGAAIMPIMNAIDLAIVTNRLSATGWNGEEVRGLFGLLTGFVNPLINLPQVLTQSVAVSLVPTIAAAYKSKDHEFLHHNVSLGLRTSILVGLPMAFGMMALSEEILLLLYPTDKVGAITAAPMLLTLGFGIIFLSTIQTLTGVLQGVGKQMIPVRNLFIGAIAKVILTYTLTGIPSINVNGAAIGTVAAYIIAATLNIIAVQKYTGTKFNIGLTYIKPAVAGLAMIICVRLSYFICSFIFGNAISTLVSIAVGAAVYAVMILVSRAITEEELRLLPKGEKLVKLFQKVKR